MSSLANPKVFVSYSWQPESNRIKVIALAERLSRDGVHVKIDAWDLVEGHDKNHFMEEMVNDNAISKVLVICNRSYQLKADTRTGGVGTESMIISEEVYSNSKQEKFIPIIFEKNEAGQPFVPTFIKSCLHIDLSNDDEFETNYEQLLRNIYNKPLFRRPAIGEIPAYLKEEAVNLLRTSSKLLALQNAVIQEKKNISVFISDYFENFITSLEIDFETDIKDFSKNDADETLITFIAKTIDLRNDFLKFLELIIKYGQYNNEEFLDFLEKLIITCKLYETSSMSAGKTANEHKKFLCYEIFLYAVCILLKSKRFNDAGYLLHHNFYIELPDSRPISVFDFSVFCYNSELLNKYRNQRLSLNRICVVADIVKERAITSIKFDELKQIDTLLYYIHLLKPSNSSYRRWFPFLSAYQVYIISLMQKAVSKNFFNKILPLFNVMSLEELKINVEKQNERSSVNFNWDYELPEMKEGLNIDNLATLP
jgi:hypothetical protein